MGRSLIAGVFLLTLFSQANGFELNLNITFLRVDMRNVLRILVNNLGFVRSIESLAALGLGNKISNALQNYINLDVLIDELTMLQKSTVSDDESLACLRDTVVVMEAISRIEMWAIQLVDANAKIESGITEGNVRWAGTYSECVYAIQTMNSFAWNKKPVQGKYCWMTAKYKIGKFNIPPIQSAICVPESCTKKDVLHGAEVIQTIIPSLNGIMKINDIKCAPQFYIQDHPKVIFAMVVIALLTLLLTVATMYDYHLQELEAENPHKYLAVNIRNSDLAKHSKQLFNQDGKNNVAEDECHLVEDEDEEIDNSGNDKLASYDESNMNFNEYDDIRPNVSFFGEILLAFSVSKNGTYVFEMSHEEGTLTAIHGIRFFSMAWVIYGHTQLYVVPFLDNILAASEMKQTVTYLLAIQAVFAIDTFFLISGLLVAYISFQANIFKNGKLTWPIFYLKRAIRITIPYMLVLFLFVVCLSPWLTSDSPFWEYNPFDTDNCSKYWWLNLFYLNNYQNWGSICFKPSWYLAVDFQFYLLSPIFLILLAKTPKLAMTFGAACVAGSSVLIAILSGAYNFRTGHGISEYLDDTTKIDRLEEHFNVLYTKPWIRMSPYIIGLGVGWILHRTQCKAIISRKVLAVGWTIAISVIFSTVFILHGNDPGVAVSAMYYATSRPAFALAVAWVIFACCTGNGGFINDFLSWTFWAPFSRVTFTAYLLHELVIVCMYMALERFHHYTQSLMNFYAGSYLMMTYLSAFLLYLFFEGPTVNIMKIFLRRR